MPEGRVTTAPASPDPDGPRRIDRIIAIYVVAAVSWIAVGGVAAGYFADSTTLRPVAIYLAIGLLLVVGTGAVMRVVLRRYGRRLAAAADAERRAADRLREVARIRAAFLRGVSHELRTPLTNIVGYGLTLNDHLHDLDARTAEQFTERLVTNARKLEQLVMDLLDLDRLTHEGESVTPEPVRLDLLVTDVLARLPHAEHVIHVKADPVIAQLDRDKAERMFEELIRNAIRHTPSGSNIWVLAAARGRSVRLTVEDDGPGIDPALRNEIFEPFTQGIHAGESPSPGLGIGLALVGRYAALQGGRVDVDHSGCGGARFEVVLPRRPRTSAGRAAGTQRPASDLARFGDDGAGAV